MERGRGGDSIEGKVHGVVVGCAGWSSFRPKLLFGERWKERFTSVLNAYSSVFSFVEVNSTFYRLPRIETARKWRKEAGDDFLFSLKAPRTITHEKRFKDVRDELKGFLEVAEAIDAFFLLFQTPKSFKYSEEAYQRVKNVISSIEGYTVGVELRGWKREEIERLVRETGVVHVVDPFAEDPIPQNLYYFRLHGSPPGEKMYRYKYSEKDLKWLKRRVEGLREVYVVFNNVWMCEDAIRFKEILGSP